MTRSRLNAVILTILLSQVSASQQITWEIRDPTQDFPGQLPELEGHLNYRFFVTVPGDLVSIANVHAELADSGEFYNLAPPWGTDTGDRCLGFPFIGLPFGDRVRFAITIARVDDCRCDATLRSRRN